jgi:flagellar protein FliJ
MKRTQRLQMVQKVVDDLERRKAEALATSELRVRETQAKLDELETYRSGYVRDFAVRAENGINGASARDYQAFLARLDEALRQQSQVVTRVRAQRDAELLNWQGAAQRAEVVGQMLKRWQTEEQHTVDKREQLESDERSQRPWAHGLHTRGA